jgi:hypothetical protein
MIPRDMVSSSSQVSWRKVQARSKCNDSTNTSLPLKRTLKFHMFFLCLRGYVVLCSLMRSSERAPHPLSAMLWLSCSALKLVVMARMVNYLVVSFWSAKA